MGFGHLTAQLRWRSDEVALLEVVADRMRLAIQNAALVRESRAAMVRQKIFLRDVLASVTDGRLRLCFSEKDLPPRLPHVGAEVDLSTGDGVQRLRRQARAVAVKSGFVEETLQDIETAVGEAGMNAYVHAGSGIGSVRVHHDTVQVWLVDHGTGISVEDLPRAALEKGYTTAGTLGHGLKLMLLSSDRIWLLTGVSGTTVVLEFDRVRAIPRWAQLVS